MFGPIAAAAAALVFLAGSLLLAPGVSPAPAAAPPIIDKPIAFTDERKQLTIEYRRIHQDPAIDDITIEPTMIVLHYTGGSSGKGTWAYFNRTHLERGRDKLRGGGAVNVSAHFLIERDGTIYRLMPETWMARHCIGLNHIAIGVENVGNDSTHPLTGAQVAANAALVRYLVARHGITHLIGHHESRAFEGTASFVERDAAYRNRKPDPGKEFMRKVREKVADLGLKGPPE
jgi:N-acetyl-anhydromuramyl-L-alanine amidase AmpD